MMYLKILLSIVFMLLIFSYSNLHWAVQILLTILILVSASHDFKIFSLKDDLHILINELKKTGHLREDFDFDEEEE